MARKAIIDLPSFSEEGLLHVVIETVRGSASKFKYQPGLDLFTLHRVLPEGLVFPHPFGFVPSTRSEDGDPLDVLFLTEAELFPGCLVCARLVGVIKAMQREGGKLSPNDRLLAVDPQSAAWSSARRLADVPGEVLAQIEHFFESYRMPGAIELSVTGRGEAHEAEELVRVGMGRARKRSVSRAQRGG